MKILAVSDVEAKFLYDYYKPGRLAGYDVIIACGDLLPEYLEFLVTMAGCPLLYVHGNHDDYEREPGGCICIDNRVVEISKVCAIEKAIGESVGFEKMTADYSTALFRELEKMIVDEGLIDIFYERAFERLIPQGHTFRIVDTTSFFSIELDTPEDFENAQRLIPAELFTGRV